MCPLVSVCMVMGAYAGFLSNGPGSYLDIQNNESSRMGTKAEVDLLFVLYEAWKQPRPQELAP